MVKLNRIIESYPPELKFLLVCCGSERWKAEDLLPEINWELFLQWVKRHRVNPAVYRYMKKNLAVLPEGIQNKIEQRYFQITKRNLLLANETIKIIKLLEAEGIKAIPIKGVFLGYQLYGTFNDRETRDIDLLIKKEDVLNAVNIIKKNNYQLYESITNHINNLESSHCTINEFLLQDKENKITIELHWQFFDFSLIGKEIMEDFWKNPDKISLQQNIIIVPNIIQQMQLGVLHGTKHFWAGLQWIIDFNYWLKTNDNNLLSLKITEYNHVINELLVIVELLYHKQNNKIETNPWIIESIQAIKRFNESELKGWFYKYKRQKQNYWIIKKQPKAALHFIIFLLYKSYWRIRSI